MSLARYSYTQVSSPPSLQLYSRQLPLTSLTAATQANSPPCWWPCAVQPSQCPTSSRPVCLSAPRGWPGAPPLPQPASVGTRQHGRLPRPTPHHRGDARVGRGTVNTVCRYQSPSLLIVESARNVTLQQNSARAELSNE